MLEEKTDIPVTGVVPYFYLDLDEEDSLTERFQKKRGAGTDRSGSDPIPKDL